MLPKPTHLLLGFFGTVVEYSRSRTAQGYERTHDLTTRMGSALTCDESRAAWSTAFDRLEEESSMSLDEFSSRQVAQLAVQAVLYGTATSGCEQLPRVSRSSIRVRDPGRTLTVHFFST